MRSFSTPGRVFHQHVRWMQPRRIRRVLPGRTLRADRRDVERRHLVVPSYRTPRRTAAGEQLVLRKPRGRRRLPCRKQSRTHRRRRRRRAARCRHRVHGHQRLRLGATARSRRPGNAVPVALDLDAIEPHAPAAAAPGAIDRFRAAYGLLLERMRAAYPQAEVWCGRPGRAAGCPSPTFAWNLRGAPFKSYNDAIRAAAREHGSTWPTSRRSA